MAGRRPPWRGPGARRGGRGGKGERGGRGGSRQGRATSSRCRQPASRARAARAAGARLACSKPRQPRAALGSLKPARRLPAAGPGRLELARSRPREGAAKASLPARLKRQGPRARRAARGRGGAPPPRRRALARRRRRRARGGGPGAAAGPPASWRAGDLAPPGGAALELLARLEQIWLRLLSLWECGAKKDALPMPGQQLMHGQTHQKWVRECVHALFIAHFHKMKKHVTMTK